MKNLAYLLPLALLAPQPAQAEIGRVGAKQRPPISITKAAENKRLRDQIERVINRKEAEKLAEEKEKLERAARRGKPLAGATASATGSAVAPNDAEAIAEATGTANAALKAVAMAPTPAVSIVFNRNYVNFDRTLRQLVQSSERSKKVSHYDVVSEIPMDVSGGRRNQRVMSEYEDNLNRVLSALHALGVHPSRVSYSNVPSEKVTAQTISIYQD